MRDSYTDRLPADADERRHVKARRWRSAIAVIVSVIALALLAGVVVVGGQRVFGNLGGGGSADFAGPGTGTVDVVVPAKASLAKIGQILEEKGVVKSASAFTKAAGKNKDATSIQPGTYRLRKEMKAAAALELILDSKSRQRSQVTIPEGFNTKQILARISSKAKIPLQELEAATKSKSLGLPRYAGGQVEGFLFPATYDVEPGTTAVDVLKMMIAQYKKQATSLRLEARAAQAGLQPLQVVTLASMIEKETKIPAERVKVSRVIHNRLDQGKRLEIDATIQYLLPKPRKLTTADLQIDSPYNTYRNPGLPPGPIASPGKASLEAALEPIAGNWIYYVVTDAKTGKHTFTADYDEFVNLKNKAKRDARG